MTLYLARIGKEEEEIKKKKELWRKRENHNAFVIVGAKIKEETMTAFPYMKQ